MHPNDQDVGVRPAPVSDDGTSSGRVDLDGEVAGEDTGDGSGDLGKIRHVLCPPPIPDVDDWGIPSESQQPCDPEVEVSAAMTQRNRLANSLFVLCCRQN